MSAADLIAPVRGGSQEIVLPRAAEWMQGRTLYGGSSALIAYSAVARSSPDLPALRAAQIGFVAPMGDTLAIEVRPMRQGRNVTQVRCDIRSEENLALTSVWLFGAPREPNALHEALAAQPWPGPPDDHEQVLEDRGPAFIRNNFEIRRAQDQRGPGESVVRRWLRLKQDEGLDPVARLVLLGDTLPPGAMRAMRRQGPISSINWSFNLLDPEPCTRDGWWLAETASEHADQGYSSERLRLWNSGGQLMMSGLQSVAIFG